MKHKCTVCKGRGHWFAQDADGRKINVACHACNGAGSITTPGLAEQEAMAREFPDYVKPTKKDDKC